MVGKLLWTLVIVLGIFHLHLVINFMLYVQNYLWMFSYAYYLLVDMAFNPLFTILTQNKLGDSNYFDWKRNLDIVLMTDKHKWVLDANLKEPVLRSMIDAENFAKKVLKSDCRIEPWPNDYLKIETKGILNLRPCVILESRNRRYRMIHLNAWYIKSRTKVL